MHRVEALQVTGFPNYHYNAQTTKHQTIHMKNKLHRHHFHPIGISQKKIKACKKHAFAGCKHRTQSIFNFSYTSYPLNKFSHNRCMSTLPFL